MLNKKIIITTLISLFSINVMASEEIEIKLIDFKNFIESKPEKTVMFKSTTRMINKENKTMEITDIGLPNFTKDYNLNDYIKIKKFIIDYSSVENFNDENYPQERIQTDCTLLEVENQIFVEGTFKGDVFKVSKMKYSPINSNLIHYCNNSLDF